MSKWRKIPREEAEQHRLYGVGGWLAALIIFTLLPLFLLLGTFIFLEYSDGLITNTLAQYKNPLYTYAIIALFSLLPTLIFIGLILRKSRFFRLYTVILYVLPYIGLLLSIMSLWIPPVVPGLDVELVNETFSALFFLPLTIISVIYLQRSRRVRVTFEHSIRSDEEREVLDEGIWSKALAEFDGGSLQSGLWAKSLAHAGGDESTAQAYYLKQRATQMLQEKEREASKPGSFKPLMDLIKAIFILLVIFLVFIFIKHSPENAPNSQENINKPHENSIHTPKKTVARELTSEELENLTLHTSYDRSNIYVRVENENMNLTVTEITISISKLDFINDFMKQNITYSIFIEPNEEWESTQTLKWGGNVANYRISIISSKGH